MNESCNINEQDDLVGQAVEEYFNLLSSGERPELEAFLIRFPDVRDILKSVIPALQLADAAIGDPMMAGLHEHRQIGDFRILRQIGRGGMGIVYEAEQISMGRRVALKVLPLAGLVDENKILRFQNEVRAVAALDHPNIVSVYLVGEERGIHYFAMQLIRGRSLAEVISSLKRMGTEGKSLDADSLGEAFDAPNKSRGISDDPLGATEIQDPSPIDAVPANGSPHRDTVANANDSTGSVSTLSRVRRREYFKSVAVLGIQAANALQHAHDHGIIHRDIKPANLLVDRTSRLYVTDFGLARVGSDVGVTMTGDFIGTLRYMPPEQAQVNRAVIDQRADIYALGVTLYELLSLRPAMSAKDHQPLLHQIAAEEPTRLRQIDQEIPRELETIVHMAMAKEVQDRFTTAQELADDLRRFLDNRPIQAKPPTPWQIMAKWTRRNPILIWASLITLTLAALALGVSTMLVAHQRDKAVQASEALRASLYASEMNIAYQAWAAGNAPRTNELLRRQIPINNQTDLRGLEWYYLSSRSAAHRGDVIVDAESEWCLSRDTRLLATVVKGSLVVIDLATQRQTTVIDQVKPPTEGRMGLAFSPDGSRLAATDHGELRIFKLFTKESYQVSGKTLHRVTFSPDGQWGANVTEDRSVQIWDAKTGNIVWSQAGHGQSDTLMIVEFSPDSRHLITAYNQEYTVRVWAVADGKSQTIQLGDSFGFLVEQAAWYSNEEFILCGGDGVRVFDISPSDISPRNQNEARLLPATRYITSIAISGDGTKLALGTESNVAEVWDLKTGRLLWRQIRMRRVQQVEFADDGKQLILSCNNLLERCNIEERGISRLSAESRLVWPESIAVHGDELILPGPRYQVIVWNCANGTNRTLDYSDEFTSENKLTKTWVSTVAVSPDGRTIASAGTGDSDQSIRIWNAKGNRLIERYEMEGSVVRLAYSPDSRSLAAAGDRGSTVWDVTTSRVKWVGGESSYRAAVCYSPDGKWLVSCGGPWSSGGEVAVWNVQQETPKLSKEFKQKEIVLTVAISHDSRLIAAGDYSGTIVVYDLQTMSPIVELDGHAMAIRSFVFSPDGRTLLSAAYDGVVKFWQIGSWREMGEFQSGDPVGAIRLISTTTRGLGLVVGTSRNPSSPANVHVHWIDTP